MSERTYSVPGISCEHCKHAIESELAKLEGVDAVTVDVAGRLVKVVGSVSDEQIRQAVDEAGYEVASLGGS
ncbi:MAG: hypothetical protein JJLCMIEE_00407 [Acidimicrobiales bacterium]|nr:MAG: copper chaperone [Actinomycetota bacterium]MBV6507363.1 hypothetical protein [Acidimicrobiales bacterium]RIK04492.1 MAG: copper-binding protein [Acidobacteriota bacterium]